MHLQLAQYIYVSRSKHKLVTAPIGRLALHYSIEFERKCRNVKHLAAKIIREREAGRESFFPIPNPLKHPEKRQLAEMWLHKIGTGHTVKKFNFGPCKLVCEDHFEKSCFVEDIRAKILGCKPRKRLKDDAVPTIFVHRKPAVNQKRSERCTKRSAKKVGIYVVTSQGNPSRGKVCIRSLYLYLDEVYVKRPNESTLSYDRITLRRSGLGYMRMPSHTLCRSLTSYCTL